MVCLGSHLDFMTLIMFANRYSLSVQAKFTVYEEIYSASSILWSSGPYACGFGFVAWVSTCSCYAVCEALYDHT